MRKTSLLSVAGFSIVAALGVCALPAPGHCAGTATATGLPAVGPRATLQHLNGAVEKLLRKKVEPGSPEDDKIKSEVKGLAAQLLDYTELARRSLGDSWTKLSAKQRTDFVATFKDLIERNYVKQLKTNLNYDVNYGDESITDEEAKVITSIKIKTKGKSTDATIDYRMIKNNGSGTLKWMVYDVITDELSLVRNYRSQFQRIMSGGGYDALLARMKKKLAEEKD